MPKKTFRRPRLRITKKGVKFQNPYLRIGGKTGVNISKSGVSASHRTKHGTISSRDGCTCCPLFAFLMVGIPLAAFVLLKKTT